MRHKFLLMFIFIFMSSILVGCSFSNANIKTDDFSSWQIEGDVRFVPLEMQHIDDATVNGIDFITFVDLKTGEMYLYTKRYCNGYGTTFSSLNETYEHLDSLRIKYNYFN